MAIETVLVDSNDNQLPKMVGGVEKRACVMLVLGGAE